MSQSEISIEQLKSVKKRLANQAKTAFVVGIVALWLSVTNVNKPNTTQRLEWWPFAIFTAIFITYYLVFGRKKLASRRRFERWVIPLFIIAVLWVMYWSSGISFTVNDFKWLAIVLIFLSFILTLCLLWIITRWGAKGRATRVIISVVKIVNPIFWPLSMAALLASVILGWAKLWDAGERGWWMEALIYLGVTMAFIVSMAQLNDDQ